MQCKTTGILTAKTINIFAVFQDRNFNLLLGNNFVKLWTAGPWWYNKGDNLGYLILYKKKQQKTHTYFMHTWNFLTKMCFGSEITKPYIVEPLYKTVHCKMGSDIKLFKGGLQKCCIQLKSIDYIEKWPFMVSFLYILYFFV